MNHQFQFARSITPRAAAKAADARPSLLPASAATLIIHDQMYGDRRAGARSWGQCDRHAPVRVNLFHGRDLPETCRGFGLGLFGAEGRDGNRVLAKPKSCPLSAERLKNFAKGSERHFHHLSQQHRAAGVLNGCQHWMPKNWESLPKRGSA